MKTPLANVGLVLSVSFLCLAAHGQTATFTIDPERSSVTLSGSVLTYAIQAQGSGSLSTRYDGVIHAQVGPSSITFTGGSTVTAQNSGNWAPLSGGGSGTAPACYGGVANAFIVTAQAAARQVVLDLTSNPIPIHNNAFDSTSIAFGFVPGAGSTLDFRVSGLLSEAGSEPLDSIATNSVATSSTLETSGDIQTLTLPIEADFLLTLLNANDTQLKLTGQLVATRTIAAPGTTFDQWQEQLFPGITDPNLIGPGADPDGDGIRNLVEFAFGLTPTSADAGLAPLQGGVPTADTWVLEFVRPTGRTGVEYLLEASNDLSTWTTVSSNPLITPAGEGLEKLTFTLPVDPNTQPYSFVRLGVRLI